MEKKALLVTFRGELICFGHALLNALDMKSRGMDVGLLIEGESPKLLHELIHETSPFHNAFRECMEKELIFGVCKACSMKMGTHDLAVTEGLPVKGEMSGHPPLAPYIEAGYEIITF